MSTISMLKLHGNRFSVVSFLTLFFILFIVIVLISNISPPPENYNEFLFQSIIFSALIALPIAFCCVLARGGTRDPKELTDGHSVLGI